MAERCRKQLTVSNLPSLNKMNFHSTSLHCFHIVIQLLIYHIIPLLCSYLHYMDAYSVMEFLIVKRYSECISSKHGFTSHKHKINIMV